MHLLEQRSKDRTWNQHPSEGAQEEQTLALSQLTNFPLCGPSTPNKRKRRHAPARAAVQGVGLGVIRPLQAREEKYLWPLLLRLELKHVVLNPGLEPLDVGVCHVRGVGELTLGGHALALVAPPIAPGEGGKRRRDGGEEEGRE